MQTLLVDESWLVDTFVFRKYTGASEFGGSSFDDEITVTNARIDYKPTYARTSQEVTRIGNAVIFCYEAFTRVGSTLVDMGLFTEKSEVVINGETYTVKQVKKYHEISSTTPFSVELIIL